MHEFSGGIFDGDTHYYETRDAFTRHLDPKLAGRGVHARPDASGRDRVWVGDEPCRWLDGVWDYDRMAGPGSLAAQLRLGTSDRYETQVEQPVKPAYRNRDARLALLQRFHGLRWCSCRWREATLSLGIAFKQRDAACRCRNIP